MNMVRNIVAGVALGAAVAIGVTACGSSGNSNPPTNGGGGTQSYQQIEVLSRPAVKEVFESFNDHDTTNRTEPYNDPTLQGEIGTFTTSVAGRSSAIAGALQSVLYPNEMVADLSSSATNAAYLGVETGGVTGSTFGGRALGDDVVDISLGAIFGNTIPSLPLGIADDGHESPCLTTDHVGFASTVSSAFPYTQAPI